MGARPSSFKKSGGGFLNNVDGTIIDYLFTDEFNGQPFKPGINPATKKPRFHTLYCLLTVQVDGAEEPVTTHLFVGDADQFDVTEDGKVLVPVEEGYQLGENAPFCRLIASLVAAGFPETNLPEEDLDFRAIIDTRCRLVQRRDEEAARKGLKRKDKKTGKEYDQTYLAVDQVYALPGATGEEPTAKSAPKGKATKSAKPTPKVNGKPANGHATDMPNLDKRAVETLLGILADEKGSTLPKSKLSVKILQKLGKDPQRQDIYKLMYDDGFLTTEQGWSYDASKQMLSL